MIHYSSISSPANREQQPGRSPTYWKSWHDDNDHEANHKKTSRMGQEKPEVKGSRREMVSEEDLVSFIGLLFWSHLTGISISPSIAALNQIELVALTKRMFETIMASLSAINTTLDGNEGLGLVSQRDKTQLISEF